MDLLQWDHDAAGTYWNNRWSESIDKAYPSKRPTWPSIESDWSYHEQAKMVELCGFNLDNNVDHLTIFSPNPKPGIYVLCSKGRELWIENVIHAITPKLVQHLLCRKSQILWFSHPSRAFSSPQTRGSRTNHRKKISFTPRICIARKKQPTTLKVKRGVNLNCLQLNL